MLMGRKKYATEEERKAAQREQKKKWYQKHKEEKAEYQKQYRQEHKEEINEKRKEIQKRWRTTLNGRANNILTAYRASDKKYNRGRGDLTAQWIIENIFSKACVYCGETDWHKLGCNRLDDSKPHSKDNVEPCCMKCNRKLPRENARENSKYVKLEFLETLRNNIGIYDSISNAYI